jgi:hypothetical protein
MAQRFISRTGRRKFIRPVRNSILNKRVEITEGNSQDESTTIVVEEPVIENKPAKRTRKKTVKTENNSAENNEKSNENDMNESIEKIKKIVGQDVEIPEQTVKYEKKDKGLIERTENSTILITEENKMLLND